MVNDLLDLVFVFGSVTFVAFGGGIGILPEMERRVVGQHGWVTHHQFIDAFALSQITPGPGMLMVAAIGFRAAGIPGAAVATLAMFGPPAFITWLTADRWTAWQHRPVMGLIRRTLAPVALGLLSAGCWTLFQLGADTPGRATLAVAAFALVAFANRAPWQVLAGAAAVGVAVWR